MKIGNFFISAVGTLALLLTVPVSVSAVEETEKSVYQEIFAGDTNSDGELNIADAVTMQRSLLSGEYGSLPCADMNSDGSVDVFDLVYLRQTITGEREKAFRKYYMDVAGSVKNVISYSGVIVKNQQELADYLGEILSDESEINKYTERYTENFFENNAVCFGFIFQRQGDGILQKVLGTFPYNGGLFHACTDIYQEGVDYPEKGTCILAQAVISLQEAEKFGENATAWLGVSGEKLNYLGQTFRTASSPNSENSLYIVSDINLFEEKNYLYSKNPDGSYKYIADLGTSSAEDVEIEWGDDKITVDYLFEYDNDQHNVITLDYDYNIIDKSVYRENGGQGDFDTGAIVYSSPDGERSIYITQRAFLLASDINVYIPDDENNLKYITYLSTDDGCCPFEGRGEWLTDGNGNSVYSGENYSITWLEDSVWIEHIFDYPDCDRWERVVISDSGEVLGHHIYDKNIGEVLD